MARNAGLLTVIGVVCFAAAGAEAAPAPMRFAVTVSGTAHQVWDHTGVPAVDGNCTRTVRSEGIRDVRLRTLRPSVVQVVDGRLLPGNVSKLTGTVTLAGANTISQTCGTERTEAIADCVRTRRSFSKARVGVRSTRPGSITLGPVRVALRTIDCPVEPAEVVRLGLGPIPGPLRISTASLANRRIARITLTARATRRTNYGPVEQGTLEQRSTWRFTLVRLAP